MEHNWTSFWLEALKRMGVEVLVIVNHIIMLCSYRFTNRTLFITSNKYSLVNFLKQFLLYGKRMEYSLHLEEN